MAGMHRRGATPARGAGPGPARAAAKPGASGAGKGSLVLIGGRGCGKSSVARRIAAVEKRFNVFSLDTLIQYEAGGRAISDIVAEHGWHHFRDVEYEAARKAGAFDQWALIDGGGGVVVDLDADGNEVFSERKVAALREHALVVYLKRDCSYLEKRIAKKAAAEGGDSNRPTLSQELAFREIMERRGPWYEEAADLVVDGMGDKGKPVEKRLLAWDILSWWYAASGMPVVEPLQALKNTQAYASVAELIVGGTR